MQAILTSNAQSTDLRGLVLCIAIYGSGADTFYRNTEKRSPRETGISRKTIKNSRLTATSALLALAWFKKDWI